MSISDILPIYIRKLSIRKKKLSSSLNYETKKKKCDNFAEPSFLLNVFINILGIRKARRSDKKGTQNIWLISFTQ